MITLDESIETVIAGYPGAHVAVAVRDLGTGLVYDRQADRVFHAASTMKVPVMIEIFRQAGAGRFSLEDSIQVRNEFRSIVDGSSYEMDLREDSDDQLYSQIGRQMTIRDLTHSMITVSSNLATNILIEKVAADSVQQTIRRLGTKTMEVLRGVEDLKAYRSNLNNTATAADLAVLLQALAEGRAVSMQADQEMIDILAEQEFNEMIPAGLPGGIRVAHKTGQISSIHHDAAVVYPTRGEPYVLVILIEGIVNDRVSARLGSQIAEAVHNILREGSS